MSKWNVFAERNEMDLTVSLRLLAGVRDQERRVVVMSIFHIDRAQQQVRFCRSRKIHYKLVALCVLVSYGFGHRTFRPNEQIGRRLGAQRDLAQARKLAENFLSKLRIEFLSLRNPGLHRRDAE